MTPMIGEDETDVAMIFACISLGNRTETLRGKLWSMYSILAEQSGKNLCCSSGETCRSRSTEVAVGVAIPTLG